MSGTVHAIARAPARGPLNPLRDAQIVALVTAGVKLADVGAQFGITMTRVRQIAEREGLVPRREFRAAARSVLAKRIAELISEGKMVREIARECFVSTSQVYYVARRHGLPISRHRLYDDVLPILVERVRAGESIWSVSGHDRSLAACLRENCKRLGVASVHGLRWKDPTPRKRIIAGMLAAGASWDDIAVALQSVEGRRVQPATLLGWARRHMDVCPSERCRPRKTKPHQPRPRRETVPVTDISGSTREVCASYYGKATASQVAAALGISRNAVIGHWFRARQAGQIGERA